MSVITLLDNISAYWKLDEASGNATDSSGGGFTLTNTNTVAYGAAVINNGADFGSANTTKSLNTTSTPLPLTTMTSNNPCSVSLWVNITTKPAINTDACVWSANLKSASNFYGFRLYYHGGGASAEGWAINIADNAGAGTTYTSSTVSTGAWHHIVVTFDGTVSHTNTVYVDKVSVGTAVHTWGSGQFGTPTKQFQLGLADDSNNSPFSGKVDECSIYTRVLTSDEINALYKYGIGLQYPFNQGQAISLM